MSHFGLALPFYTHFTSPIRQAPHLSITWRLAALTAAMHSTWPSSAPDMLSGDAVCAPRPLLYRRYADVVAHRQLLAVVSAGSPGQAGTGVGAGAGPLLPPPLPGPEVSAKAVVMNERHRTAKRAQKECSDLYLLLLLHSQVRLGSVLAGSPLLHSSTLAVPGQQQQHQSPQLWASPACPTCLACSCSPTWRLPQSMACAGRHCWSFCPSTTSRCGPFCLPVDACCLSRLVNACLHASRPAGRPAAAAVAASSSAAHPSHTFSIWHACRE